MQEQAAGNRLSRETSPYLLQHQANPVHWWAWGEEALADARATGKPILLSVGYAACHWCHVMAHESFEDEPTARLMNELFVNIKVDREERPDVDAIYMAALHQLGEQGGWPLTMFLTSEGEPFWGGTYFPREARFGRPAFSQVLKEVARVYREDHDRVMQNAELLRTRLKPAPRRPGQPPDDPALADLAQRLTRIIDPVNGGIRGAPKFPQPQLLNFLWRGGIRYGLADPLDAVDLTLTHIAQGGIYDHLGGGFARYATDERWLVPHFEKMLYDNALLIELMVEVWRERKAPLYAQRIAETIDWLLREMVVEAGGFAASLDADSEGEEGKFYVWSKAEIDAVLGDEDAALFAKIYDVTEEGNWEGQNILNRLASIEPLEPELEQRLARMRAKLLDARTHRIRPGFDDKVLADWNGLMIAALAKAADVFVRVDWLEAAERAFAFICTRMAFSGRLWHAYRAGSAKAPGTASDYTNMIKAALALASVTGKPEYLAKARGWSETLDRHYWAEDIGGYYLAADDTRDLIVRPLTAQDESTPNANGIMAANLNALYLWTGEQRYRERAEAILKAFAAVLAEDVFSHTGLLSAAVELLAPTHVVLIVAEQGEAHELRGALSEVSLPGAVVQEVNRNETLPPSSPAHGKASIDGRATAYLCVGPRCAAPVTSTAQLIATLKAERRLAMS